MELLLVVTSAGLDAFAWKSADLNHPINAVTAPHGGNGRSASYLSKAGGYTTPDVAQMSAILRPATRISLPLCPTAQMARLRVHAPDSPRTCAGCHAAEQATHSARHPQRGANQSQGGTLNKDRRCVCDARSVCCLAVSDVIDAAVILNWLLHCSRLATEGCTAAKVDRRPAASSMRHRPGCLLRDTGATLPSISATSGMPPPSDSLCNRVLTAGKCAKVQTVIVTV